MAGFLLTAVPNWTAASDRWLAACRPVQPVGSGKARGDLLEFGDIVACRPARCRLLRRARTARRPRGARGQQPQHPGGRDDPSVRSCGRPRLSRQHRRHPIDGHRMAARAVARRPPDLADRRPHHSLLHAQLDGEARHCEGASDAAWSLGPVRHWSDGGGALRMAVRTAGNADRHGADRRGGVAGGPLGALARLADLGRPARPDTFMSAISGFRSALPSSASA